MPEAERLKNEKQLLKQYYAGQQMESPNGGFLMLLGIRAAEGGALGILECSATSMRYQILIPKATRPIMDESGLFHSNWKRGEGSPF